MQEKTKVVIDTNIILNNPEVLLRNDIDITLPYVVIAELDKLKRNPELSFPARKALKILLERYKKSEISVVGIPTEQETNDEKIIQSAKELGCKMFSADGGANLIALANDVELFSDKVIDYDDKYIGYRYIQVNDDFYYKTLNMVNELQHEEVDVVLEEQEEVDVISINEYVIFTPNDNSANFRIFRKTAEKYVFVPDGNKNYKGISDTSTGRKLQFEFLHPEQACAFDAVFNSDTSLAVIHGKIGSGKTLLSMLGALSRIGGNKSHRLYDKILVTRPNRPISKAYELGFMPGDLNAKMSQWLAGFTSNLEFLFNHTQQDVENEVAKNIFEEYFQPIAIESIQGFSFNKKILLVDEAQLLDTDTLRQVMSRAANGSKLVLILDTKQTYGANRGNEGYKKLFPHLKGNKLVSFINLQHIQRSELTAFVDDIFE